MRLSDIFKVARVSIPNTTQKIGIFGQPLTDASVNDPTMKFQKPMYSTYNRTRSYPSNIQFYKSEYDLETIANAVQLDGMIHRSVCIFVEQIMKNGYDFVSMDERVQAHITKRIREIELNTNVKNRDIIEQISTQLVTYGNAYVIKVRGDLKPNIKSKKYKLFKKEVKPIIGLFVADATTMRIGLDDKGRVTHYQQWINGNTTDFYVEDVIHITYNKIPGTLTGISNIHHVIDDIRALRKLEEEIEILGFQYSIPLYLYKVGTDNHPAQIGEVDAVTSTVNNMPTYGVIVTPHTHDMKAVTNSNQSIDIMQYVEHFKKRIFAGLGVSPIAMGDASTSNRNTSESLDISMQNTTKTFQRIISNSLEQELLNELLLDGGFDLYKSDLELKFPEIDLEAQIKKETHILQKYQSNLITFTEARKQIGADPKVDDEDLFLARVTLKQADAAHQQNMEMTTLAAKLAPKTPGVSSGASKAKTKTSKPSSAEKSVKAKSQPQNQHGKQLSRPKIKKDSIIDSVYNEFKDTIITNNTSLLPIDKLKTQLDSTMKSLYLDDANRYISKYSNEYGVTISDLSFVDEVVAYNSKVISSMLNRITVFSDNVEYKVNTTLNNIKSFIVDDNKIKIIAKINTLQSLGYRSILFSADECAIHSNTVISLEDLTISNNPMFKTGCKCCIKDHTDEA